MSADTAGDILCPHQQACGGLCPARGPQAFPRRVPAPLTAVPTSIHTGGPEAESAGPDFTPVTTGRSERGYVAVSCGIQHLASHTRPLEPTPVVPVESLRVLVNNTFLSLQVEQVLGFECVLLKDRDAYVRERDRGTERERERRRGSHPGQAGSGSPGLVPT